ncbi:MAG: hypothetical protein KIS67_25545 [Verrucomicrobiae bacterium]|nr:hypothetical protein [Verrucomicrobiae bacterium]
MKTGNPPDDDKGLSSLLNEWKVKATLPPRFQEQVWRRIEREEPLPVRTLSVWMALQNWITNALPRPALAVAYVGLLLVAGAGIGWTHARSETERVSDRLSMTYVKSVDPYLATH